MYGLLPEAQLPRADSLRWLQMNSTGADAMMYPAFKESGIQLTTIGAAITVTVAEHALALLFALARNLHLQRDHQHRKEWTIETGEDIAGMTLGILGLGRIGRAVATRAHAFGMDILAIDPIARDKPHCVRALWGIDRLPDLLRQSKAIVCTVPKTPATTGMIGAQQLAMLPHGSFVVN
ncbi:MAG: hypothetical protein JXR37_05910, partial [Kiritimatiellae bacterium]|nr:hypothetical protein [Kiritimatiellia bacterium]